MARKQRRKGVVGKARPRLQGPPASAPVAATSSSLAAPRGGRVGGDQALVRSVEMSLGPGVAVRGKGRNRFVLEGGNPAIPLDRVPYFLTDLRRIGIIGGLMVVVMIAAAYTVIPLFVR